MRNPRLRRSVERLVLERGWTMSELARRSGLSAEHVRQLLCGERRAGAKARAGLLRALRPLSYHDLFRV